MFKAHAHGFLDELTHVQGFLAAEIVHLGEFLDGEAHGHFSEHLVGYPGRYCAFAAFPLDDGSSGAVEFCGEFFAGHAALFAEVTELFWGDFHAR